MKGDGRKDKKVSYGYFKKKKLFTKVIFARQLVFLSLPIFSTSFTVTNFYRVFLRRKHRQDFKWVNAKKPLISIMFYSINDVNFSERQRYWLKTNC